MHRGHLDWSGNSIRLLNRHHFKVGKEGSVAGVVHIYPYIILRIIYYIVNFIFSAGPRAVIFGERHTAKYVRRPG